MPPVDRSVLFADRAQRAAVGVVNATIVKAARQAVDSVAAQTEAGYLAESSHDVAALRRDSSLVAGLADLEREAYRTVKDACLSALEDGYRTTTDAQAKGLDLAASFTDSDRAALAGFPIVDATAEEWAGYQAERLTWRIRSVATRAALHAIKAEAMAGEVYKSAMAWAQEVGRLSSDAWHAGRSAAVQAMAGALTA